MSSRELMNLHIRFLADKEAHEKILRLESRAPKLWDKVDRMYKYKEREVQTIIMTDSADITILSYQFSI